MIHGILSFQLILYKHESGEIEPQFKPIKLIFTENKYHEKNFTQLIHENDIFSIFYMHTSPPHRESYSDFYTGRLKNTSYQVKSYFRQESNGSQFITILVFDINDDIDRFEKEINVMASSIDKIFTLIDKINNKKNNSLNSEIIEKLNQILTSTLFQINRRNIKIFLSYSNKDSDIFQISKIVEELSKYERIEELLYYEGKDYSNIYKFMNDNIEKCDIMLSFSSENATMSKYVQLEWQAALSKEKRIIPIFFDKKFIPALLGPSLGVQFDNQDIKGTIDEIYRVILKSLG